MYLPCVSGAQRSFAPSAPREAWDPKPILSLSDRVLPVLRPALAYAGSMLALGLLLVSAVLAATCAVVLPVAVLTEIL